MPAIDVTDKVEHGGVDDECLPITKCVCGTDFPSWKFIISVYEDTPYSCPQCGARLFFSTSVKVYQIREIQDSDGALCPSCKLLPVEQNKRRQKFYPDGALCGPGRCVVNGTAWLVKPRNGEPLYPFGEDETCAPDA